MLLKEKFAAAHCSPPDSGAHAGSCLHKQVLSLNQCIYTADAATITPPSKATTAHTTEYAAAKQLQLYE
jgi:hypothetical protein